MSYSAVKKLMKLFTLDQRNKTAAFSIEKKKQNEKKKNFKIFSPLFKIDKI